MDDPNLPTPDKIHRALAAGQRELACQLILSSVRQKVPLGGDTVFYSNLLLCSFPWAEVSALLHSGTNSLLSTGWLESVMKGRPVNAAGDPIPWLTYPAIDFLDAHVKPDWKVFEWGSGNSTLWWSRKCRLVRAVESNRDWHSEVSRGLPGNASVFLAESHSDYVGQLGAQKDGPFDAIVIDGDHRNDCAEASQAALAPGGLIVFDNTDCDEHRRGVEFLSKAGLHRIDFFGGIPSYTYRNCTSIFLQDPAILTGAKVPADHVSSVGLSCGQAVDRLRAKK